MNTLFKLPIRAALHFKTYSVINILGLALSLACVVTISRYVYGELTVDHFHKKIDRIYTIVSEFPNDPTRAPFFSGIESTDSYHFVLNRDPSVERFTTFSWRDNDEINLELQPYKATVLVADSCFLKILDFPVIAGSADLSRPESALITEAFARKLFGKDDPIGKVLQYSSGTVTITGIIGATTLKSSLQFDVIISYYLMRKWSMRPITLILLVPGHDYKKINERFEPFFEINDVWGTEARYQLFPLRNLYLNEDIGTTTFIKGNRGNIYLLLSIGILILLIGVINFVNIYTSVVLRRRQETGILKVFGATGRHLFIQLWLENVLLIGLSLLTALALLELCSPLIRDILGFRLIPFTLFDLTLSLALLLFLPLVTSLFPFIHYHRSVTIKSISMLSSSGKRQTTRKTLLCLQYVLTMFMITVSLFFVKQLNLLLHTHPGFRTQNIIVAPFLKLSSSSRSIGMDWEQERKRVEQIQNKVRQSMDASPLFEHWCTGYSPVTVRSMLRTSDNFKIPGGSYMPVRPVYVDEPWFKIFDISPIEGRTFRDSIESLNSKAIIVTKSAAKLFDIADYQNVTLQYEMHPNSFYRIIGVVEDVHPTHLGRVIDPVVFLPAYGRDYAPLLASIVPGRTQDAIAFLQQLHNEIVGGEFTYSFIEDQINSLYAEDKKVASVYSLFTVIAIIISALGLFGMSLFDIRQRYREIALRKVNGALASDIIVMLLKHYALLLGIAFLIAAPAAWIAIQRYLEDFSLKANLSWWIFAVSLVLTSAISLLTLAYQTQKAANSNPVQVMHHE